MHSYFAIYFESEIEILSIAQLLSVIGQLKFIINAAIWFDSDD